MGRSFRFPLRLRRTFISPKEQSSAVVVDYEASANRKKLAPIFVARHLGLHDPTPPADACLGFHSPVAKGRRVFCGLFPSLIRFYKLFQPALAVTSIGSSWRLWAGKGMKRSPRISAAETSVSAAVQ